MRLKAVLLFLIISFITTSTFAKETDPTEYGHFYLQTDIITQHWGSNDFYNNDPNLVSLEYHLSNSKFYGFASFENSFYQPSWYIYTGKTYQLYKKGDLKIRWKITAGIAHGYDDEDGKYNGFINKLKTFPAIMPTIGFEYKHFGIDLIPLSIEGFMFTSGIRF
ncbi:hypothetical protein [Orenia marismortui]|uniref:hypothetical protein n=1 Tax=Orenia marismortui TaxID=46469 RepID=UPI000375CF92|nr:hypothetical protein [Orenia marismortui]